MMKRRLDLTPGFPAFLAAVWYFDSCGIFWPFLAAMTVHELAHAAVLLLLGGRIESVRLSFAQVELRTGLLSDRTELSSTAAGPGINLLCGWLFRRWMPAFAAVSLLLEGIRAALRRLRRAGDQGKVLAALGGSICRLEAVGFGAVIPLSVTAVLLPLGAVAVKFSSP